MGFRSGSYATVWSVETGKGKFNNVRLSISRKNKDTDQYEDEFSGFCMFIGEARAKSERLKERDRIKLGDVDVTRRYDKDTRKEYYTFKVFSFETEAEASSGNHNAPNELTANPVDVNPAETDELPF